MVVIDDSTITATCDGTDSATVIIPSVPVGNQADRILVVSVGAEDSTNDCDLASATALYDGTPMVLAVSAVSDTTSWRACNGLFYLINPPTGTGDVVMTFADNFGSPTATRTAGAWVIFNARQAAPEATAFGGEDPSSVTGFETNITTLSDNALVLDIISEGNEGTFTQDAGQQFIWQRSICETAGSATSAKQAGNAGTKTLGWTHDNPRRVAHALAAFAPASGSPGTTTTTVTTTSSTTTTTVPPVTTTLSTTTTTMAGPNAVQIDDTSIVSTCEGTPGNSITVPNVAVGSMPNQILVVSVGAEENNADCNLADPEASAFYGATQMQLAASSVSDVVSWRTCNGVFYLLNPPTGVADVVVTFPGDLPAETQNMVDNRHAGALVLYNADQTAPVLIATDGAETGANAATPLSIGPVTPESILVDVYSDGNLGTLAPTEADQIERWEGGCASSVSATSTRSVTSAGSATLGWTHSNPRRYAHSAVQFGPQP